MTWGDGRGNEMSQGSGDTINVTRSRAVSGSFGRLGGRSRGEERQYDLATWRGQERSFDEAWLDMAVRPGE